MKFKLKSNYLAQLAAIALYAAFVTAAQAAPVVISGFGTTSATIDDAGYFSSATPLGLNINGKEFINHGTWASNWSFNANGVPVAIADEVFGNNPLVTTAFGVSSSLAVVNNLGGSGWSLIETVSIPANGHVAININLTNNTGADASRVQWSVGFDPDQGFPVGLGFGTTNEILALGNTSAVSATSLDGWSVTLHNTTGASAFAIAPYIDPLSFSNPTDPALILAAAQGTGSYGFANSSINLGYDLGFIPNGDSVAFGYEYILAVPEPDTFSMLLAGSGLIGFSARRRRSL